MVVARVAVVVVAVVVVAVVARSTAALLAMTVDVVAVAVAMVTVDAGVVTSSRDAVLSTGACVDESLPASSADRHGSLLHGRSSAGLSSSTHARPPTHVTDRN